LKRFQPESMLVRSLLFWPAVTVLRHNSTASSNDFRARLMNEIKTAMKAKNTTASTVFRSALSEINNADKWAKQPLSSSAMIGVVRKAIQCRHEAAVKFKEANRADLAEKEEREADLLNSILPPLMTVEQIDKHLNMVLTSLPTGSDPKRSMGIIFKEFYARVDQGTVTGELVKQRIKVVTGANA